MLGLTKRQSEVLAFIKKFIEENGYSPSYEEIGIALGMRSQASVFVHVRRLRERGALDYMDGRRRSLRVLASEVANG